MTSRQIEAHNLQFSMVCQRVARAVKEDKIAKTRVGSSGNLQRTVETLSRLYPNRVYNDSDGLFIATVLFFRGNPPYQAYCEVRGPEQNGRQPEAQYLKCKDLETLEKEISGFRDKFGLEIDLIEKPSYIKVACNDRGESRILHTYDGTIAPVFYYYKLSAVGPVAYGIGNNLDMSSPETKFDSLHRHHVPKAVLAYAHPFLS